MKEIRVIFNEERCKGCDLCVSVCPVKIIRINTIKLNKKGYHAAGISEIQKCIGCANCAVICPDGAISIYRQDYKLEPKCAIKY